MSGPVTGADGPVVATDGAGSSGIEVFEARRASVGGLDVARALPRRTRRTVGAWCFADHFGPAEVRQASMQVGPHPHIGLHTATWLVSGEIVHRDSLGSEQPIRPGQLNLMTAGNGVAHAEETSEQRLGTLEGVQLWIAQPDATRRGEAAFAHHADLPVFDAGDAKVAVFVGALDGRASPATLDVDLLGAEVVLAAGGRTELPLRRDHEHAVLTLGSDVVVDGESAPPEAVVYLPPGRDSVDVAARNGAGATLLLLGGVPFDEPLLMWWNFVGRDREEIAAAYADWQAGAQRFGAVDSELGRIDAPRPNWLPV